MTMREWVLQVMADDKAELERLTYELRTATTGPLVDLLYSLGPGELPSINNLCGIAVEPGFGVYTVFPNAGGGRRVRIHSECQDAAAIENLRERAPAYLLWIAKKHKGACRDMAVHCDNLQIFIDLLKRYSLHPAEFPLELAPVSDGG